MRGKLWVWAALAVGIAMLGVIALVVIGGWLGGSDLRGIGDVAPGATKTSEADGDVAPGATKISEADGMVQVYVPEGTFLMGSASSDPNAYGDEFPQHEVDLDAFWIDQTEVTNAMYQRCVAAGACDEPATAVSNTRSSYYGNSAYTNYPVIHVSWHDAVDYCAWAGRRLPTEAEWEKTARGTDGRLYPWGNSDPSCNMANYSGCARDTSEVGSYPQGASPYGALDMAGNVWESVADWYDVDYYDIAPRENPQGPGGDTVRVLRGGAWYGSPRDLRAAFRSWNYPDGTYDNIGFRCAVSP